MFIDGHAVYDSLSPAMQASQADLHPRRRPRDKSAEHPVVRTHPDTGRPALFVNKQFRAGFRSASRPNPRCCCIALRWQEQVGSQPGGGGRLAMS